MYKPKTIRVFAIVAIVLSVLGLLLSGVMMTRASGLFFLGVVSWVLLLWASIIGYQLSRYPLDGEECKKVGLRIYLIIGAFIGAFGFLWFLGPLVELLVSASLLATLRGLKRNYDEWNNKSIN